MIVVVCPYCGDVVHMVKGDVIYPHRPDLFHKNFYRCEPCGAHVGCHPGTTKPLGRLANAELRKAKSAAHAAFDPLWKQGLMSRTKAYKWLSDALQIKPQDCHIGMMDVADCRRVVDAARNLERK